MTSSDYPALYRAAEKASVSAQLAHYRTFVTFSLLSIFGAGLAVYGIDSRPAALAAALVFVGALFLSVVIAVKRFESVWYAGRAVAESIKTNVWRFMVRAEPYDCSDYVAQASFRETLRGILAEHRNLGPDIAGTADNADQLTERMLELRTFELDERVEYYKHHRINEQRDWYASKASYNKRAATFWFWALVGFQACAVALSLARVLEPEFRFWPTEVFVVAAAGVLGWTQTKRFRELASAYALTAHEIGLVKSELGEVRNEQEFSRFVNQAENAFSREHTQWIARRE